MKLVAYEGGQYLTDTSVIWSVDGGKTWEVLTRNVLKSVVKEGYDGAHEASCVRVHPVTRYAYVSGQCFGWWKIAPPGVEVKDVNAAPRKAVDGTVLMR